MQHRTLKIVLAASLLLSVASCVELIGQRISWFHDVAKDNLKILIHYDGIHEGTGRSSKGVDQIPAFIGNGDIMILDWWGHLEMGPIRAKLKTGNLLEKMVAKTLTSFEVRAVGHYRDPAGRIGALQVITVPKVSRLVKSLNEMISLAVKAGKLADKTLPKSTELQKEAAGDRHEWLAFDGHALRIQIPVHPDEAAKMKGRYARRGFSRAFARTTPEHKDLVRRVVDQIAAAPVSIIHEEEMLTLVFGYKTRPCTIRISARDDHNQDLDQVVQKNVPTDLDRKFAAALIERTAKKQPDGGADSVPGLFGDMLRWGPPENQVGALLKVIAETKTGRGLPQMTAPVTRLKASHALSAFGADWTSRSMLPPAPQPGNDEQTYHEAWEDWYHVMAGRKRTDRDQ